MSIFGPKKPAPAVDHVAAYTLTLAQVINGAVKSGVASHVIVAELQSHAEAVQRRAALNFSPVPRMYSGNKGDNLKRVS